MWQLPALRPDEILIYLRKSRADDPTLSVGEVLARHEQMLDDWVERSLPGLGPVPEGNRFREVVSGETIESRPEIQRLLRRIESPRVKALLIVEPQRLSRGDLEDIGRLVKLLRYTSTLVITLQYTYDLRDDRDRDAFERELKRGNEYLEYIKRIMYNGRVLSVENGNYIGTFPPYGYRKVMLREGRKKIYTLEPIPEEADVVRLIFEMYRDGHSSHGIARHLNALGLKTQLGREWSPESLKKMRTNEHYLGKVVWDRRKTVRSVEDGEVTARRPVNNEHLVYEGRHPAIIDQELWDAVQAVRDKIPPVKAKRRQVNPFAGIVYCTCGKPMTYRTYAAHGEVTGPPRMLCDDQVRCGSASCFASEVVDEVVKALTQAIADFDAAIKADASDEAQRHRQMVERLDRHYADLERREVSLWDKYTQEAMPKAVFDELNERVLREKEEARQALDAARAAQPKAVDYVQKRQTFHAALEALTDPDVSARQKNLLLKQCIERIEYHREKKKSNNRRWGDPEPIQLDFRLRV